MSSGAGIAAVWPTSFTMFDPTNPIAQFGHLKRKQFEHLSIACSAFREAPSGWIGNKDTFKSVSSFRRKLAALSLSPNRSPKVYSFCQ